MGKTRKCDNAAVGRFGIMTLLSRSNDEPDESFFFQQNSLHEAEL